ncbi:Glu/Leu/Phe/Val dehydrogenase dimerization domain-containing protein [Pseudomonas anguilliseptica]|uniref:Glu/Leu/Phe/Val dehydrogenase dimerization domain-containing protein n=1 Tax=Pseudomonas anguilliseptica TaxID=53406 RepID=UPI00325B990B
MSVFSHIDFDHHEQVVYGHDKASGLKAIIAIHNSNLGPALGGCRMWPYANDDEALRDVLRLSRGMTYKSALANLPLGGGKAVIIGDPHTGKSAALFQAMGDFVDSLGGRYITAADSGTGVAEMQIMAERTRHVSGAELREAFAGGTRNGDPSPSTAYGVFIGIQTAVKHRLGRDDLHGLKVAIQGVGQVGFDLARQLKAAGAANNQLADASLAETLRRNECLYAPDYAINAGGIIDVYYGRSGGSAAQLKAHIEGIGATLEQIFQRADAASKTTVEIADQLAEERFGR